MDYYLVLLLMLPFVWAFIRIVTSNNLSSQTLPPGPHPFPIIGNILELGKLPHQEIAKLSKTYGPLMTLKLGSITTIVISSPTLAKEALQKNDQAFSSRTIPNMAHVFDHHKLSMAWIPTNAKWKNLRKASATQIFATKPLDATQALRQTKLQELLDHVNQSCKSGAPIDIGQLVFTTVLNSISNTFFSMDLAQYDSNLSQEFRDLACSVAEEAGRPNIADYFPALRLIDPQGVRKRTRIYFSKVFGIFDGIINQRLQLRASSKGFKESNDVLDSLLNLTEEDNSEISLVDIKHLLLDLFLAGIDTTSSTVEWAMAVLLHNPIKMAKARDELDEVLGKGGHVQESDISKFHYLQAIVKETFRLHPPVPFLIPHKAETNIEICGFIVPKNAQTLINVWAMGRDSSIWQNPNLFMPERFLEQDIDFKGRDFELIPFGAGRRICPGLPLANRMVHLMLASLVYYSAWKLPDEMRPEHMDMGETFGLTLHREVPLRAIPIKSL
ncbi:cytochrome P450 76T24-like isoform X4 [Quercus robur]|uniref:cytochrome P450 76T24-like isoform X4 n=1 Tax=Quercus robur TaxID=38942 RepID=UPI002161D579|nr:cytochrome P450 76T24-like isoform X4 [Quercus robur]